MGICASILDGKSRKKKNAADEALIAERRKSMRRASNNGAVSMSEVKNPVGGDEFGYEPPKVPPSKANSQKAPVLSAANLSKNNGEALALDTEQRGSNRAPSVARSVAKPPPSVTSGRSKASNFPIRKPLRTRLNLADAIDKMSPEVSGKSVLQPPPNKDIYITGWLLKRGHRVRNWKRRFFVMSEVDIKYYVKEIAEYPYGVDLKGSVNLAFSTISYSKEGSKDIIELVGSGDVNDRDLLLTFQDKEEMMKWTIALKWAVRNASITHLTSPSSPLDMIPSNAMEQDENYATTNVGISNTVTKGVVCGSELDVHKGEAWFYHEKIMYERALILGFYKTKKEDTGIIVPSHLDMVGTPFELQQGEIENILVDNYSNRKTYRMTRVAYGSDGRITPQTIDIQFYYKLYDEEEPFEEVMFDHENRNTKISPILSKIIASSRLVDCPPDCLGIKYAPVQALDGKEPHWTCIALADITDVVLGILAPGTVHSMNDSLGCGHFGNNGANQIELTQTAFSVIMEKCSYSIEFYPDPNHSIEFTEFTSVLSKMLFFQQICVSCGNLTSGYSLHGKMKAKPTVNAQAAGINACPVVNINRRMVSSLA